MIRVEGKGDDGAVAGGELGRGFWVAVRVAVDDAIGVAVCWGFGWLACFEALVKFFADQAVEFAAVEPELDGPDEVDVFERVDGGGRGHERNLLSMGGFVSGLEFTAICLRTYLNVSTIGLGAFWALKSASLDISLVLTTTCATTLWTYSTIFPMISMVNLAAYSSISMTWPDLATSRNFSQKVTVMSTI